MNIRNGFVSNSSTSSFVIVGYRLDFKNLQTIQQKLDFIKKWNANSLTKIDITDDKKVDRLLREVITETNFKTFDIFNDGDSGDIYAGNLLAYVSSDDGGCCQGKKLNFQEIIDNCNNAKKEFDLEGDPMLYSGVVAS